jgi:hypothetical protein
MARIAATLIFALLCATAVSAQSAPESPAPAPNRSLKMPVFVWAAAVATDQITTFRFASAYGGVIHEENPLTHGLESRPALLVATGTAVDAATGWLAYRLLRNHPRLGRLAFYGAAGYRAYLAVHNIRMMQQAADQRALSSVSVAMR